MLWMQRTQAARPLGLIIYDFGIEIASVASCNKFITCHYDMEVSSAILFTMQNYPYSEPESVQPLLHVGSKRRLDAEGILPPLESLSPPPAVLLRKASLSQPPSSRCDPGARLSAAPWPHGRARTLRIPVAHEQLRASELVRDSEAPGSAWMLVAPWRRGHRANSSDLAEGTAGAAASTHPLLRRRPVRGLPLTPGPVPAEVQDSP